MRLLAEEHTVGAMNLLAEGAGAFDEEAHQLAEASAGAVPPACTRALSLGRFDCTAEHARSQDDAPGWAPSIAFG